MQYQVIKQLLEIGLFGVHQNTNPMVSCTLRKEGRRVNNIITTIIMCLACYRNMQCLDAVL